MGKRRPGTPPAKIKTGLQEASRPSLSDYPLLCFRHLRSGYGVEELTEGQRSAFLIKWAKRSQFTWTQLIQHDKHGLGHEFMPKKDIKPSTRLPEPLAQEKYMVMRHEGNLPFLGFRVGDTFHVLWIEAKYGDVYKH